jgi:hypothetical protein
MLQFPYGWLQYLDVKTLKSVAFLLCSQVNNVYSLAREPEGCSHFHAGDGGGLDERFSILAIPLAIPFSNKFVAGPSTSEFGLPYQYAYFARITWTDSHNSLFLAFRGSPVWQ